MYRVLLTKYCYIFLPFSKTMYDLCKLCVSFVTVHDGYCSVYSKARSSE